MARLQHRKSGLLLNDLLEATRAAVGGKGNGRQGPSRMSSPLKRGGKTEQEVKSGSTQPNLLETRALGFIQNRIERLAAAT